jgi:hypothetical protein
MPDPQDQKAYRRFDLSFLKEQIVLAVQSSAYWRHQKAEQYPEDKRNERSAAALDRLAEKLMALPTENQAYRELASVWFGSGSTATEAESYYIGRYGFDPWREECDPEAFLDELREVLSLKATEESSLGGAEPVLLKPHVFLSHVREDAVRIERLSADLEARGIRTWIDRNQIKPGQRWQDAIEDAIRSGAFFVACFSKAYAARPRSYMNEELSIAIEEVRLRPEEASWFIPLRLDDCEVPNRRIGPTSSVHSFQWLDMFPDWAKSIERLAEAMRPPPR